MKESFDQIQLYKSFFQQRAMQEEKYANEKVLNTRNAFENNWITASVYMNSSSMLNFLTEKENEEKMRIKELVEMIKNNIIKDILDQYIMNMSKELLALRERLSGVKSALKKSDELVCS